MREDLRDHRGLGHETPRFGSPRHNVDTTRPRPRRRGAAAPASAAFRRTAPVEQHAFENGGERTAHRVVAGVAGRAHRRPHTHLALRLAEDATRRWAASRGSGHSPRPDVGAPEDAPADSSIEHTTRCQGVGIASRCERAPAAGRRRSGHRANCRSFSPIAERLCPHRAVPTNIARHRALAHRLPTLDAVPEFPNRWRKLLCARR